MLNSAPTSTTANSLFEWVLVQVVDGHDDIVGVQVAQSDDREGRCDGYEAGGANAEHAGQVLDLHAGIRELY